MVVMRIEERADGHKYWIAETDDERDAMVRVNAHVPLFAGAELYGINAFLAAREGYVKVYQRTDPDVLSDRDLLSVTLTVASWKKIRDEMFVDADAESTGPAETALYELSHDLAVDPSEDHVIEAQAKDANEPCHSCASATEATASLIAGLLEDHGWE
jgi:hypothetical protein